MAWGNHPMDRAIFGSGVDAATRYDIDVDLAGLGFADSILFNNSGYVLSSSVPQMIVLSNVNAAISIAAGKTATIGANVTLTGPSLNQNSAVAGGGTLILENGGALLNSGTANSNVLNINSTTVEVRTGGSLLTTTVGNAIFVNGRVDVMGGLVDAIGTLGIGQNASFSAGTFTLSSGTVNAFSTNGVRFGGNSGTTPGGTLNLDGGVLTALKLAKGTGTVTTSVVNLNGGVLKASDTAVAAFFTGLGRANVRDGGAIIDSNNKNITIAQALLHSNISGDAATDGGLTKSGAGLLTLSGANTYNGGTVISGGALRFDANALPATGNIEIKSGGSLVAAGAFATVADLLASGRVITASTGSVALGANSSENIDLNSYAGLHLGAAVNSTYTGTLTPTGNTYRLGGGGAALKLANENALTGANNLLVEGAGSVVLANANNFTGATTIKSGTLQVGDGVTDGSFDATSSITNDGTLLFQVIGTQTAHKSITGTGSLVKQGGGTLILAGDNSYSGTTTLGAGILQLAHAHALGTSALNTNSGTAQLQLSGDITVANAIRVQGSGRNLDGILKNVSGTNTLTDFGFFTPGGTRLHVVEGSTLILPNSIALAPSAPPQNIRILGTGTLSLGGDNSVAIDAMNSFLLGGGTAPGPIIEVGNDLAFGTGTIDFQPLAASTVKSASATAHTIANPLKFSDSTLNQATFGAAGTGDLIFTGPATLNGDLEAAIQNVSTTLSGAISGDHAVTKTGPGTLVLAGLEANDYSGGTTVSIGMLDVRKDGGLGTGDVSVFDGATLKLELGVTNNYISDDGVLLLAAGSPVVNLAFTGVPDTIAGLSFDGGNTFAAPGIWGSPTSGAEFTSSVFTGTGTLLVVPEPATAASLLGGLGLLLGARRRRSA